MECMACSMNDRLCSFLSACCTPLPLSTMRCTSTRSNVPFTLDFFIFPLAAAPPTALLRSTLLLLAFSFPPVVNQLSEMRRLSSGACNKSAGMPVECADEITECVAGRLIDSVVVCVTVTVSPLAESHPSAAITLRAGQCRCKRQLDC